MLIFALDPIFGGPMFDSPRRDQMFGGNGTDYFVLSRDGKTDTIWNFEDGKDRIDLRAFEVQIDSVMIRQISETEWTILIRDELTRINFNTPDAGDPPIDLTADDFIFDSGDPPATPQVILDRAGLSHLHGTSLPDVFTMMIDTPRDVIHRFEKGKDVIDLSAYNTDFSELNFIDKKPGRVVIHVDTGTGVDHIVVKDYDRSFTSADFSADDFIF